MGLIVPWIAKVLETGVPVEVAFFTVGIVYADWETFCVVNGFNGKGVGGKKEGAKEY